MPDANDKNTVRPESGANRAAGSTGTAGAAQGASGTISESLEGERRPPGPAAASGASFGAGSSRGGASGRSRTARGAATSSADSRSTAGGADPTAHTTAHANDGDEASIGEQASRAYRGAKRQARAYTSHYSEQAKGQISELASSMTRLASEEAERRKSAGIETMHGIAQAVRHAADDLEQEAPMAAQYVRTAASGLDRFSETLRERSVGDMIGTMSDFARRQPVTVFAGALIAGLALTRFAMAGTSDQRSGSGWGGERRFSSGRFESEFDDEMDDDEFDDLDEDDLDDLDDDRSTYRAGASTAGGGLTSGIGGVTGEAGTASPAGSVEPRNVGLKGTPGNLESRADATGLTDETKGGGSGARRI